jgi:histidyl-tRNA synthetase
MRDMLPGAMERFRRIEDAFRAVCQGWGYDEIRTPTIEHLYLFAAAGALSPQMLDRVYSFLDWDGWSGERVVLRPDSTIPSVRLFAEEMSGAGQARLFYVQNVFRFDPGDRSREDWQCGVELLGDSFPAGDVELILIARESLSRLGIGCEIELSHPGIVRGLLESSLDTAGQTLAYDRLLAGDTEALDEIRRGLPNEVTGLRLIETSGSGPAYLENLRAGLSDFAATIVAIDELAPVSRTLADMKVAHTIAPLGVRNFEYYTGPVFNLASSGQRIGGGGRYDSLAQLIAGRGTPASGFALEMDVLAALLPETQATGNRISIQCSSPSALSRALALSSALRDRGASVAMTSTAATAPFIRVTDTGFTLTADGHAPRDFSEMADVLQAAAGD